MSSLIYHSCGIALTCATDQTGAGVPDAPADEPYLLAKRPIGTTLTNYREPTNYELKISTFDGDAVADYTGLTSIGTAPVVNTVSEHPIRIQGSSSVTTPATALGDSGWSHGSTATSTTAWANWYNLTTFDYQFFRIKVQPNAGGNLSGMRCLGAFSTGTTVVLQTINNGAMFCLNNTRGLNQGFGGKPPEVGTWQTRLCRGGTCTIKNLSASNVGRHFGATMNWTNFSIVYTPTNVIFYINGTNVTNATYSSIGGQPNSVVYLGVWTEAVIALATTTKIDTMITGYWKNG